MDKAVETVYKFIIIEHRIIITVNLSTGMMRQDFEYSTGKITCPGAISLQILVLFSLAVLLFGIYLSIKSKFRIPLTLGNGLRRIFAASNGEKDGMGTFSALCTNLGATIGTGKIVGVAMAVMTGGPGALFWVVLGAFFCMTVKFCENAMAVRYRSADRSGKPLGGPFCYISQALGKPWLSRLYALSCLLAGVLGMGTIIQSNAIAMAVEQVIPSSALHMQGREISLTAIICGAVLAILTAFVIFGGGKRIVRISTWLVPIMAACYVLICLTLVICNIGQLPIALKTVFQDAFTFRAVAGGGFGAFLTHTVAGGIRMGIFSNEAGIGTGAISSGSCTGDDPVAEGYAGAISVFVDTVFLCTLTGLTLVVTEACAVASGPVTAGSLAWSLGLAMPEVLSRTLMAVFLSLFAFTSIIGWNFYAERCVTYLFESNTVTLLYQCLYVLAVFLGPFLSADFSWKIADIANMFMLAPNLLALLLCSMKQKGSKVDPWTLFVTGDKCSRCYSL